MTVIVGECRLRLITQGRLRVNSWMCLPTEDDPRSHTKNRESQDRRHWVQSRQCQERRGSTQPLDLVRHYRRREYAHLGPACCDNPDPPFPGTSIQSERCVPDLAEALSGP